MKAHNVGFMRKSWGPKPKATKILTEATDETTDRSFDLFKYYRDNDIDGAVNGVLNAATDIAQDRGFVKHSRDV